VSFLYKFALAIMHMLLQVTMALKSTHASFNWRVKKISVLVVSGCNALLSLNGVFWIVFNRRPCVVRQRDVLEVSRRKGTLGEYWILH